jgi:hypothetical protein
MGARQLELNEAIAEISRSVAARPIASLSDIVDRAILTAWACRWQEGKLIPDEV